MKSSYTADFLALYNIILLFSFAFTQFIGEYLELYKVPPGTKINDCTCEEFFGMVERFPAVHKHHYILDFLIKTAERYREDGCARSLVLDLVKLRVPNLLRGVLFKEASLVDHLCNCKENTNFLLLNSRSMIFLSKRKS